MSEYIRSAATRHLEKGIDEDEATEESEDFNPADTPDNLEEHPYGEESWQQDYDRGEETEKECDHTDHRGRPLDDGECPWCSNGDE